MKYLLPILCLFIFSCDNDENDCILDCGGACNENVELWGECYNIETTTSLLINNGMATGTIPSEIGDLANLTWLAIVHNPDLSGPIPPEIGNLTNLAYLDLADNDLTGEIPVEIGNLINLTTLGMDMNQLSGEIPSEMGQMENLISFWASSNQLSGAIPSEIGQIENLNDIMLANNNLTNIPTEITSLNLMYFDISSNLITSLPDNLCDACTFDTVNQNDCMIMVGGNQLCEEYYSDCLDYGWSPSWEEQDQSNCCEGPEGQANWTTCP